MYDVGKVKAGANRVYKLAPNPVTAAVLIRTVRGSLVELQKEFGELKASTRANNKAWMNDAAKYEARLDAELAAVQKVIDAIAAKQGDWQGALKTANDYAAALQAFLAGTNGIADCAYWATLANQLEPLTKHDSEMFWSDVWLGQWAAAIDYFSGGEEDVATLLESAKQAGAEAIDDAKDLAKPALGGLLTAALLIGGGFLAWKVLSD